MHGGTQALGQDSREVGFDPSPGHVRRRMDIRCARSCEYGGRMAVLSDENAMIELLAGRYSRGAPHLSSLNTAHDGGRIRVARKRNQMAERERHLLCRRESIFAVQNHRVRAVQHHDRRA